MNMATAIPGVIQHAVQSGSVTLAVYSRGNPQHPTVVLVHGYPDSSSVWDRVAGHLAADFHVVTYDVRGAGASDRPSRTKDYKFELLANDLACVIDAVSPERPVHLVGHDWGSIQSWEAVCRPELQARIASFTSISGPCFDHAGHWLRRRLFSLRPRYWLEFFGQLLRSWYIIAMHVPLLVPMAWRLGLARLWPQFLRHVEGASNQPQPTRLADGQTGVRLYRANFFAALWRPRERRTQVPVLLLRPAREHYVSPHINDDLRQWAPRLWQRDIAAGHWPQLSRPHAVATNVREFAQCIERGDETAALRRSRVSNTRKSYSGKLAIVTGAGSGIGREVLFDFAERGAVVVAVDINQAAAERSARLARLLGAEAHAFRVDVGSTAEMTAFAGRIASELGAPDIVVNNAGIGIAGAFLDTEAEDWERVLNVNLWGVIHGARLFGRQMVAAGKVGNIINVASAAAFSPSRVLSAYATSKAAVFMLSDCLRGELAAQGIQVSTICPGFVDTAISTSTRFVGVDAGEQERKRDASKRLYQLRNLKPQAVSSAIRRAVDSGQPVVLIGIEARSMRLLHGLAPWLTRAMAKVDLTP